MGGRNSKKKAEKPVKKKKGEMNLAILGIAASGKSTFARQMRLVHQSAWTGPELANYYSIIVANLFDGIKEISWQMKKHEIECDDPKNVKKMRFFIDNETEELNETNVARMKTLWSDKKFQECYHKYCSEVSLHLEYFVNKVDEIAAPGYVPSDDDILHCRQRTTGGATTTFMKDKITFNLIDMGGQRPERAKWDRVLDTVKGIFFFVSIEEYNVQSTEEKGNTKLEIALEVWKNVLANPKLAGKSIILLFNKIDLLQKKLSENPDSFTESYPAFSGSKVPKAVTEFIRDMFLKAIPEQVDLECVSVFECCALDTSLMGRLWNEARTHIRNRAVLSL